MATSNLGYVRRQPIVQLQPADIERGQVDWVDVAYERWIPAIERVAIRLAAGLGALTIVVQIVKHVAR